MGLLNCLSGSLGREADSREQQDSDSGWRGLLNCLDASTLPNQVREGLVHTHTL